MIKQIIISLCLTAGIAQTAIAQNEGPTTLAGRSHTEVLFDFNNSNTLRHRFVYQLKNGNSITIRVSKKSQLERLLSFDSLLAVVTKTLQPLSDSFQNPLNNRRIDILDYPSGKQTIRHKEYAPKGSLYVHYNNELSALKVEQDTLVLIIYDRPNSMTSLKESFTTTFYSQVTILLNNIQDLSKITDGTMDRYVLHTKNEWDELKKWSNKLNAKTYLYGRYDTEHPDSKFNKPLKTTGIKTQTTFAPYVQLGLQNVNNLLTTSAGVGFELTRNLNAARTNKQHYQLLWEPYFFFDRQNDKNFRMRRNDFVSLQYQSQQVNTWYNGNRVEFNQNFSVGYLVHRSGNYFYNNTFKMGFPGMQYKFLLLHPEFIFSDLFKNFQPSLKLVLNLD